MEGGSGKEWIDLSAASLLTGLCLLWGLNAVAIKVSNQGIAPIYGAGVRSVIATGCLVSWMKLRKIALFPGSLPDGLIVGVLFGVEFGILYSSLLYTTASSAWILLYTTPFFHAVGAHYFLEGDRLNLGKGVGLVLAFGIGWGTPVGLNVNGPHPSLHELSRLLPLQRRGQNRKDGPKHKGIARGRKRRWKCYVKLSSHPL